MIIKKNIIKYNMKYNPCCEIKYLKLHLSLDFSNLVFSYLKHWIDLESSFMIYFGLFSIRLSRSRDQVSG